MKRYLLLLLLACAPKQEIKYSCQTKYCTLMELYIKDKDGYFVSDDYVLEANGEIHEIKSRTRITKERYSSVADDKRKFIEILESSRNHELR